MTISNITIDVAGQIGVNPRIVRVVCDDTLSEVTTAGFLNHQNTSAQGGILLTDIVLVKYDTDVGFFKPSISSGIITLVSVMADVALPTIANYIATFSNTEGGIKNGSSTATNPGNINAGLSGTAGALSSFPATEAKGSLKVAAVANTGDTVTTISNAAMGQASVVSIPDPAAATANFAVAPAALVNNNLVKASGTAGLVADAGHRIISNTTATYGGGGTTNQFVATGLTAASKGSAVIRTSTNSVSITKALPGTNTLDITFSADPGAGTTVDYIYTTAAAS